MNENTPTQLPDGLTLAREVEQVAAANGHIIDDMTEAQARRWALDAKADDRKSVLVDGLCRDCGREPREVGVLGRELRRAMYEAELNWAAVLSLRELVHRQAPRISGAGARGPMALVRLRVILDSGS